MHTRTCIHTHTHTCTYAYTTLHLAKYITLAGIAISLKSLLKDDDEYVRCQSAQALTILASKEHSTSVLLE